jgi:hypothetical protein
VTAGQSVLRPAWPAVTGRAAGQSGSPVARNAVAIRSKAAVIVRISLRVT